jgi:hypothetical protein
VLVGDRRAHGPQAPELVRLELAEAVKVRAPRERADADQLDPDRAIGHPGQDLQELQLVVEIVLEPQHDSLARLDGGVEPLVAVAQTGLHLRRPYLVQRRQVRRAQRAQLGRRERRDRPLVEDVPPGDDLADDMGLQHRRHGRVAVRDVEHELSLSHPCG